MKREIKFRAWHTARKEVYNVYGWHSEYTFKDTFDGIGCDGNPDKMEDVMLMQFTGLKDKTGKEVYADDILKDIFGDTFRIYDTHGGFVIKESIWMRDKKDLDPTDVLIVKSLSDPQCYSWIENNCEVVGNIYENPELT